MHLRLVLAVVMLLATGCMHDETRRGDTTTKEGTLIASDLSGLLAYTVEAPGGQEDVVAKRLGGDASTPLARSAANEFDSDISPDGRLVAYRVNPDPRSDHADIWVVSSDGTGRRNLTQAPELDNWAPAWSPDGARIAFSSTREGGTLALWTMAPDGSRLRRITRHHCEYADWAPDGERLVCAGPVDGSGSYELWVVDAASGDMRRLTNTPESEFHPAWSPDGLTIAYQRQQGEAWVVETIAPDGGGGRRVSAGEGSEPVWSPDGLLAWGGPGGLHVARSDGSGRLVLADLAVRLVSWAR